MHNPVAGTLLSRNGIGVQFALYLFVGGLSFAADLMVFMALLPFGYGVALIPGFAVGTLTNYLLSRLIAFKGGRYGMAGEIAMLASVAATGAVLTMILVFILVHLGTTPVHAKIAATPAVLLWNFLGRRYLVFTPRLPDKMQRLMRGHGDAASAREQSDV